jgi:hypothetical protein
MTLSTPIYFQNDQWAVTSFGLERVNGRQYFLEGAALAEIREWRNTIIPGMALHLAEKEWVDLDLMMPAFAVGVACHVCHHRFGAHWYRNALLAVHAMRVDQWNYHNQLRQKCSSRIFGMDEAALAQSEDAWRQRAERSEQEYARLSEAPVLND